MATEAETEVSPSSRRKTCLAGCLILTVLALALAGSWYRGFSRRNLILHESFGPSGPRLDGRHGPEGFRYHQVWLPGASEVKLRWPAGPDLGIQELSPAKLATFPGDHYHANPDRYDVDLPAYGYRLVVHYDETGGVSGVSFRAAYGHGYQRLESCSLSFVKGGAEFRLPLQPETARRLFGEPSAVRSSWHWPPM